MRTYGGEEYQISRNERKINSIAHQEAGETRVEPGQACLPEKTLDCDGGE